MNNKISYIHESHQRSNVFFFNKDIPIWIKDALSEGVDLNFVLRKIENIIPSYFLRNVYSIRIGTFEELLKRQLNALYHEGIVYISNIQDNNIDMIDDIVHEIAHSVEQNHKEVYEDGSIEREFLGKRNRIADLLIGHGYELNKKAFLNPVYNHDFDMMLFKDIGYPKLASFCEGLFLSPYSVTSINEYFAIGFEDYYFHNTNYLKKTCPLLAEKLNFLDDIANGYI